MFVRAKLVKGNSYAYLVENKWVNGRVKQLSKKYLGRVIFLTDKNTFPSPSEIDFSESKQAIIKQIICLEFLQYSFTLNSKKTILSMDNISINLLKGKIKKNKKDIVLFLNGRYVYGTILSQLIDFLQPESHEDTKGEKLATAFSDAGISISQDQFIQLYKKIYFNV